MTNYTDRPRTKKIMESTVAGDNSRWMIKFKFPKAGSGSPSHPVTGYGLILMRKQS